MDGAGQVLYQTQRFTVDSLCYDNVVYVMHKCKASDCSSVKYLRNIVVIQVAR